MVVMSNTGLLPSHMGLIDATEEDVIRFTKDDQWIFQPKHDGHRCRISARFGVVLAMSRQNVSITLPRPVIEFFQDLDGVFDGELVDRQIYHVFDVLRVGQFDWWERPAKERAAEVLRRFPIVDAPVIGTVFAQGHEDKVKLFLWAHKNGMEGIVAKKNVRYFADKSKSAYRFKFQKSGSVICIGHNKRTSFDMGLFDGTRLGTCPVYSNQVRPEKGQVVEVRFAYRSASGRKRLIHPRYLGIRTDVLAERCVAEQFPIKGEER